MYEKYNYTVFQNKENVMVRAAPHPPPPPPNIFNGANKPNKLYEVVNLHAISLI